MSYTVLEKMQTAAYAVGSALATATTLFAAGTTMAASTPLIATGMVLGTAGVLLHTANATLKQIRKDRKKLSLAKEQDDDHKELMKQLAALKPQMQLLLDKEKEKIVAIRKKMNPDPVLSADQQALKVAQIRKETSSRNRAKVREKRERLERREKQLIQLDDTFQKLNNDLNPQPLKTEPLQTKKATSKLVAVETWTEKVTGKLAKIVPVGTGFFKGFGKAGAVTFGFIQTCATMAKSSVPILSPGMVVPVVLVGTAGALGNAYLASKEYANELQEDEQHEKYRTRKEELQAEYYAIIKLLGELNKTEQKPGTNGLRTTPAPKPPLPGAVPAQKAAAGEKVEERDGPDHKTIPGEPPSASPKATQAPVPAPLARVALDILEPSSGAPKTIPSPDVAITIRPGTASSGASSKENKRSAGSAANRPATASTSSGAANAAAGRRLAPLTGRGAPTLFNPAAGTNSTSAARGRGVVPRSK